MVFGRGKDFERVGFLYLATARVIDSPLSAWSLKLLSCFLKVSLDDRHTTFSKHNVHTARSLWKTKPWSSAHEGWNARTFVFLASGHAITNTPERLHFTGIHVGKCEQRWLGGFFFLLFNGDWHRAYGALLAPSGWEVLTSIKLNNTGCVTAKPLNISLIRNCLSANDYGAACQWSCL